MSRRLPLIGVTTYYAEATWGAWSRPAAVLPAPYLEKVAAAGGRPVLLPPFHDGPEGPGSGATTVVDALDALLLVGGGDLDPASYGQAPVPEVSGVDPVRDAAERALLAAALEVDLPVLAICRGLQLLNVHLGGTLHQDLPQVLGHRGHQPAPGQFDDVDVATVEGSRLAGIVGRRISVRCSHHQAVDELGRSLVVSARSVEPDLAGVGRAGVVEGVELPGHRFVLGVQWHPEEGTDLRLFESLLAAAGD